MRHGALVIALAFALQGCAVHYPVFLPVDVVSIGGPAGDAAAEPFPTTTTFLGITPREVTPGHAPRLRIGLDISNRSGKDATVDLTRITMEEVAIGRVYQLGRAEVAGQTVSERTPLKAGDSKTLLLVFDFPEGFRFDAMGAFRLRWAVRVGKEIRPFVARFEQYLPPEPHYHYGPPWWYYPPIAIGFGFGYRYGCY